MSPLHILIRKNRCHPPRHMPPGRVRCIRSMVLLAALMMLKRKKRHLSLTRMG